MRTFARNLSTGAGHLGQSNGLRLTQLN
jgi:hypothetical protein